jgi:hypothetical protein
MKNNLTKKFVMTLILGVLLLLPISAIAVSIPNMEEVDGVYTYEAYQNNVEDFKVVLQTGTENPVNIKVEILEGSEVIELMEENTVFLVSPGEKIPVQFRIVSPPGSNVGDVFSVRLRFSSSDVGEGALAFGTSVEQRFNVLLVEMPLQASLPEEQKPGRAALIIAIAIIVVLILLIIVLKVRKGQKPKVIEKKPEKSVKPAVSKKKVPAKKKK